jgi:hypothetical protein
MPRRYVIELNGRAYLLGFKGERGGGGRWHLDTFTDAERLAPGMLP